MRIFIAFTSAQLLAASVFSPTVAVSAETRGSNDRIVMPSLDPDDPPAVILFTRPGMSRAPERPEFYMVHVAAWSDGRVVWSRNLEKGGSPYCEGSIDPEKLRDLRRLLVEDTSATAHQRTFYVIPDAAYVNIFMRASDGRSSIKWQSAHPCFNSPNVRFSSNGVSLASDFDPAAPVSEEEKNFRRFRQDFDLIQKAILDLPPAKPMRFE